MRGFGDGGETHQHTELPGWVIDGDDVLSPSVHDAVSFRRETAGSNALGINDDEGQEPGSRLRYRCCY